MTVSQMTLETALIDILDIKFTPKNDYSEDLITQLAELLITQNGSTQPLIVKKIGIDSYELIEGEIVLIAALKAQKIDSSFELLRVYIQKDINYTLEKQLIAKIEKTKTEKIEYSEVIETINEYKQELETKTVVEETEEHTDWLIIDGEYIESGHFLTLIEKRKEIKKTNVDANISIKSIRDKKWLQKKQAEYAQKLADVENELNAFAKFIDT